ncbi:MAG TPA: glycosyltransferase [Gemmatimonadales bacterium]|jgi:glycosyltransferase involved in cell wall biosynthesis|nr:glycosyltransferase [Gemmatimonadales bacterium]
MDAAVASGVRSRVSASPLLDRPRVVVFRSALLGRSEAFIRDQGEALRRFEPWYVGCRLEDAVEVPVERRVVVNTGGATGRVRELLFKFSGRAPGLRRRLQEIAPALVHAHFGPDATLVMPLARRLGVPLVATFHGYDATMADRAARRSFFLHRRYLEHRAALQRDGRLFLAVSRFVRERLLAQGYPADRTVVHYAGLSLQRFQPDRAVVREEIVLFVGRLAPEKGCLDLIGAMRRVQDDHPEAELVVLGDGPLRQLLERLARSTGVRCRFIGAVSQEDVIHWMTRAQVLCAPSVTLPTEEAEGFGLVCAEAQAMALPVVATRVGGIPEVVADGESGLLVRERDQAALADRIVRVLRDHALRDRMGEAGRRRVERCFNGWTQARRLEKLYAEALA